MKYYIDNEENIRFYANDLVGRVRKPRARKQQLFVRFGEKPFIPMRIAYYRTPKFYYIDLMLHRRKQDLDYGVSKIKHGIWVASYFMMQWKQV